MQFFGLGFLEIITVFTIR